MSERRVKGFCALCRSRCGCISVVRDGRLAAVEPWPEHPTGKSLCAKGRAAPELVHHSDRLLHPLKRTRPKGAADAGWTRISWEEALALAAEKLGALRDAHGAESVAFAVTTPSGTSMSDGIHWVERLVHAFGSPNNIYATELCNWHKDNAHAFTFGAFIGTPDYTRAGCILLWGHNPSTAWLSNAEAVAAARARGAKLIVVDPRRAGLAGKADVWLRVRPGTDGALALAVAGEMIARGWYDAAFMRRWSNGPLLIGEDGAPLRDGECFLAWDETAGAPVRYDPAAGRYERAAELALFGEFEVAGLRCKPAFAHYAELCRAWTPERAAATCWVEAGQIREAARLLWEARPVCFSHWTGIGQHSNATQTSRALALLYAMTGSWEAPGGNVQFAKPPVRDAAGWELQTEAQLARTVGGKERPIGPARQGWITGRDFQRAAIEGEPYRIRGLMGFGANLALAHAEPGRMRAALQALDFHVQADLFMTPTASEADLVLPVASAWEREGLRAGFELDAAAAGLLQLRTAVVEPQGEARSDSWIVFELAKRLGLGSLFWGGDLEAGLDWMLEPTGFTAAELRARPDGVRVPVETPPRRYEQQGFATPSRKVEVWSETLRTHGQPALPEFVAPAMAPDSRPDLAAAFPLVLTSAKTPLFCHSQGRALPSLRRKQADPVLDIHPDAAAARGLAAGNWVEVETPAGRARARIQLNRSLDPRVVCGQHGWWQECPELGLPGFDPFSPEGANYNGLIGAQAIDPVSGAVPHRAFLCEVRKTVL